jgi:hypothetical protein
MNLVTFIRIISLLKLLAPLVPQIYAAVKETFGDLPGEAKFDAFLAQVHNAVAVVDELRPYADIVEAAVPSLKKLVDKYHAAVQAAALPAPASS